MIRRRFPQLTDRDQKCIISTSILNLKRLGGNRLLGTVDVPWAELLGDVKEEHDREYSTFNYSDLRDIIISLEGIGGFKTRRDYRNSFLLPEFYKCRLNIYVLSYHVPHLKNLSNFFIMLFLDLAHI